LNDLGINAGAVTIDNAAATGATGYYVVEKNGTAAYRVNYNNGSTTGSIMDVGNTFQYASFAYSGDLSGGGTGNALVAANFLII
jgi:hypothetical protein